MQGLAKEGKARTFPDARIQRANAKLEAKGRKEGLQKCREQEREWLQVPTKRWCDAATANRLLACRPEHDP